MFWWNLPPFSLFCTLRIKKLFSWLSIISWNHLAGCSINGKIWFCIDQYLDEICYLFHVSVLHRISRFIWWRMSSYQEAAVLDGQIWFGFDGLMNDESLNLALMDNFHLAPMFFYQIYLTSHVYRFLCAQIQPTMMFLSFIISKLLVR